jgi:hypothetical protein
MTAFGRCAFRAASRLLAGPGRPTTINTNSSGSARWNYRVRWRRAQQEHKQNTEQRNPGNQPERVDVRQHIGLAAHNAGEHRRALCGRLANSRRAAAEWAGQLSGRLRALIPDFAALLATPTDVAATTRIEPAPTIGRPLGRPEWIATLARRLGRPLAPSKPDPKPRVERDTARQAQLL